ncbi:MAG TPA: D-2-hydroxyacid dehydrogenase [Longimicrobiales bacterium]|nr:D-2-hydroxyacid dehydrogenase [Longimicrobiales bacterium]
MIAVVDFRDRRPVWTLPSTAAERLREGVPAGWELRFVDADADGSGDGGAAASPEALAAVGGAQVYLGAGVPPGVLDAGPDLRWIHSGSAGVSAALLEALEGRDIVFTNSAGTHAPPVAETALAMMLHFARGLDFAVRGQAAGRWDRARFDAADGPVREFAGSTVGVIGYGGIGSAIGRRAAALGARVLGLRRTARPAGSDEAAEVHTGAEGLRTLLRESDYLVLALPETEATRTIIDAAAIAAMRPGAVLVNVARGRLVDEEALVAALQEGRLRGAALDVFAREPLPEGHPLWAAPNALLTPHVSAVTTRYWEREVDLILDNARRFEEGKPLRNVVDRGAGY